MSQNVAKMTRFVWDENKQKAAEAIAKSEQRVEEIATSIGISRRTLERWQKHPDFQRKVDEIVADIDIAQKAERIKIAKKEIKRVMKRLELNEDRPTSRDLVALLRFVGEEVGDYEPKQKITHEGNVIIQAPDLRKVLQENEQSNRNTDEA